MHRGEVGRIGSCAADPRPDGPSAEARGAPLLTVESGRKGHPMATIVVTEDDDIVRSLVVEALQRDGHRVLAFDDAAPALDRVDFGGVDLIVTDLRMPMHGEQFILLLRERGVTVPVIVISAYLDADRSHYLESMGVHRLLPKPIRMAHLRSAVREMLETGGLE
jgi:DNA-binding NtrC family response regulator